MIKSDLYTAENMFLSARRLFSPLYCYASQHPTFSSFYSPFPFFFSSSATQESPVIVDYLIKTVGMSPAMAIKPSKSLAHLKSFSKAEAVIRFFKESGFSDAHIKRIVSLQPNLLVANVDTTLKPKMIALKEFGFSESEIHQLVLTNPIFLRHGGIQSKIEFWRSFLGSKENLFNALFHAKHLICCNLDTNIKPKVSFFRDMGYSNNKIASMINGSPNFIGTNLDSIKSLCKRAEEMGFSCGSPGFFRILVVLSKLSTETLNSKLKLLRSFGWSEAETSLAIRKAPRLLETSEKKMKAIMEFLVNQAGSDPSFVMKYPRLLSFSLMKRIIPRNHVLQLLRKKVHLERELSLYSSISISDMKFVERYIEPYREEMPELHQIYITHCAGNSTLV